MLLLKKLKKPAAFPFALLLLSTVFLLILITVLGIIVLISVGLLSLAVSVGNIAGILSNVASDLAPPAILLAGIFCIFSALSLLMALYLSAFKVSALFQRVWNWFRLT